MRDTYGTILLGVFSELQATSSLKLGNPPYVNYTHLLDFIGSDQLSVLPLVIIHTFRVDFNHKKDHFCHIVPEVFFLVPLLPCHMSTHTGVLNYFCLIKPLLRTVWAYTVCSSLTAP